MSQTDMNASHTARRDAPDGWTSPEAIWNIPAYALAESLAQSHLHGEMAALTVARAAMEEPAISGLNEQTRSLSRYLSQACATMIEDDRYEARDTARRNAITTLRTIALLCRRAAVLLPPDNLRADELRRHASRLQYLAAVQTRTKVKL